MRARAFTGYVLLSLLAACSPSESVEFGPDLSRPRNVAGNADGGGGGKPSALGGAASVAGSGGKAPRAGAETGGAPVAGTTTGGVGGSAAAGDGNPPDPPTTAGADNGGAAGEPGTPEPVCGNGVIEAGEECDGGASKEKDGCSDDCKVVCAERDQDKDLLESADHHCYAGYDQADFAGSREACTKLGAHLVTIGSLAENELVAPLVKISKFLGAFEDLPLMTEGKGDYAWITGEPLTYKNWAADEPSLAGVRCTEAGSGPGPGSKLCYEHCVGMVDDGKWHTQLCDRADGYICEWEPPGTK